MSWETELIALVQPILPRFYEREALQGAALPYGSYQGMGGQSLRYVEGDASDKRHALIQIDVWASAPDQAAGLIRQIEDAICLNAGWTGEALGEPRTISEPDLGLYGRSQDFELLATR